ncbi:Hypothetical predicted protein [Podarcis lilfordi]|uniref:Uncharacterized protein n=1 Tax=Podarcis lilfordi TaxID=74358 RepID=A0AA35KQY2_9SAUR|nr:Hypothetical predicted protein [Podarcis lilfordi]
MCLCSSPMMQYTWGGGSDLGWFHTRAPVVEPSEASDICQSHPKATPFQPSHSAAAHTFIFSIVPGFLRVPDRNKKVPATYFSFLLLLEATHCQKESKQVSTQQCCARAGRRLSMGRLVAVRIYSCYSHLS